MSFLLLSTSKVMFKLNDSVRLDLEAPHYQTQKKKYRSLGNIQHDINTRNSGKNQEIGNSNLKSYNQLILSKWKYTNNKKDKKGKENVHYSQGEKQIYGP